MVKGKNFKVPSNLKRKKVKIQEEEEAEQNINYLSRAGSQLCKTSRLDLHAANTTSTSNLKTSKKEL